jgi:hypothetical protein
MKIIAPLIDRLTASEIMARGKREMIPILIYMLIPLPIPFSVIFSTSHIQNIVPATRVKILEV